MRRHGKATAIILAACLLAIPHAAATWMSGGSAEPDTSQDVLNGRMYLDPDASLDAARRVYFNAYPAFYVTSFSPNVAALGTRLHGTPIVHYQALLGVWKDCNKDGYVGLAEGALREYRAELLPADTPCPRETYRGVAVHNDGAWVAELLALGAPDPCEFSTDEAYRAANCTDPRQGPGVDARFVANPHVLYANGTLMWGDTGAPGSIPTGPTACPLNPLPRGTTSGTGHAIAYADCGAQSRTGQGVVSTLNAADALADPQNALGLRFEDDRPPQQSSSRLNVHFPVNLYGNPTTGKSGLAERNAKEGRAFVVWECSAGQAQPAVRDADASWWDGAVSAFDAFAGDCDPRSASSLDEAYPAIERPLPSTSGPKASAFVYFVFNDGSRGTGADPADLVLGRSTPPDLGIGYNRRLNDPLRSDNNGGPQWDAHTNVAQEPPLLTRDMQPAGRVFTTFYAKLAPEAIATYGLLLPMPNAAAYGAASTNCGGSIGAGAAPRGGWACDPAAWYRTADGQDAMPYTAEGPVKGRALAPRVGEAYQLLDVDCLDGRVASGVHASLAMASPDGVCL